MQQNSKVFVGLDTSKLKISVAVAEEGRQGEVRFLGDIDNTPEAVRRLVHKLASRHGECCCATIKTPCFATIKPAAQVGLSATLACIAHRACLRPGPA